MPTLYGPWSDSQSYRDPVMLATLARHSADMLRGVLVNRNLDPDTLTALAGKVRWTATLARTEPDLARYLLAGRSIGDQVILATSMVAGHLAWIRHAAEHIGLHAAYELIERPPARGGTDLARRILGHELTRLSYEVHTDADMELYLALLEHDEDAWEIKQSLRLQHAAGDPQALLALTATLATWDTGRGAAEPGADAMPDLNEDTLADLANIALLCTYGQPQVVRHWATHAGSFGVRVAATDHRQDAAWLETLRGKSGAELLDENPALSNDEHIKAYLADFSAALFDSSRHDELRFLASATIEAARETRARYSDVTDLSVEQQSAVVDHRDGTLLAQFECVAAGSLELSQTARGLDTILEFAPRFRPAAPLLNDDVIRQTLFYERSAAQGLRPDLYLEITEEPKAVVDLAECAETAWSAHTFEASHGVRVLSAGAIAPVLTSAAELTRLANREWDTTKVTNLAQAVADIAASKQTATDAMHALLPNALGALV